MRIISWNVNGVRAVNRKEALPTLIHEQSPDILCLQEVKCDDAVCQAELVSKYRDTYPFVYFNTSTARKGYSGTAMLCKTEPKKVTYGLPTSSNDDGAHNREGRVITAEFARFTLVTVYTPNSGADLKRLEYRTTEWDVAFRAYIKTLQKSASVIVCGDLNVAPHEIDIHSPKTNTKSAGFTPQERASFAMFMTETKMVDTFRHNHPTTIKYSYWSNFNASRARNAGWRIDFFLVDHDPKFKFTRTDILDAFMGSDHAPILLEF